LPILECDEAYDNIDKNDVISIDFVKGEIINETKNQTYKAQPFPEFVQEIMSNDGLINHTRKKLGIE